MEVVENYKWISSMSSQVVAEIILVAMTVKVIEVIEQTKTK
jgi:hypothetical protein